MPSRTGAVRTVADPSVACNTPRRSSLAETPLGRSGCLSVCSHAARAARLFGVGRRPRPGRGDLSPLWADPAESATNLPIGKPPKRNRPLGSLVVGLRLTLNQKAGRPSAMAIRAAALSCNPPPSSVPGNPLSIEPLRHFPQNAVRYPAGTGQKSYRGTHPTGTGFLETKKTLEIQGDMGRDSPVLFAGPFSLVAQSLLIVKERSDSSRSE